MCDGPLQHGASGCLMVAVQAPKCRFLLLSVSNRTVLASTGNTSALLAQRVNLTHSNEIALFYHPICSAQRPLVSPPLPQFEEDLLFPCRDIVLCECINGGDYAAERFFFFNLMHMHFKRHSFATYQVLAADFASPIPSIWGTCERAFCNSRTLLSSKGSCTIVWPVETRVSAKITGTLATRSGCLQKEKTDMTYDKLGNWRTSNFWTEKLQTWGLINEGFQQQTECSFSFWIWRFLFAFFCFSPNGVPWCSLALESSMNV